MTNTTVPNLRIASQPAPAPGDGADGDAAFNAAKRLANKSEQDFVRGAQWAFQREASKRNVVEKPDARTRAARSQSLELTDEQCDALADAHRWDTRDGRRAIVRAAAQSLEQERKDAARYRWLRDKANRDTRAHAPMVFNASGNGKPVQWNDALYDEWLDAAMDTAMSPGGEA